MPRPVVTTVMFSLLLLCLLSGLALLFEFDDNAFETSLPYIDRFVWVCVALISCVSGSVGGSLNRTVLALDFYRRPFNADQYTRIRVDVQTIRVARFEGYPANSNGFILQDRLVIFQSGGRFLGKALMLRKRQQGKSGQSGERCQGHCCFHVRFSQSNHFSQCCDRHLSFVNEAYVIVFMAGSTSYLKVNWPSGSGVKSGEVSLQSPCWRSGRAFPQSRLEGSRSRQ